MLRLRRSSREVRLAVLPALELGQDRAAERIQVEHEALVRRALGQRDRLGDVGDGLLATTELVQRQRAARVGVGVVGRELDRARERLHRLLELLLAEQLHAAARVVGGLGLDRIGLGRGGDRGATTLLGCRLGVRRAAREHQDESRQTAEQGTHGVVPRAQRIAPRRRRGNVLV
jgi:hypothetical protein